MTLRFEILSVAIALLLAKSTSAQTSRVSRVVVIGRLSEVESGLYQVARFSLCTDALLDKVTVDLVSCRFATSIATFILQVDFSVLDDASKVVAPRFGARNVFMSSRSPPTGTSRSRLERADFQSGTRALMSADDRRARFLSGRICVRFMTKARPGFRSVPQVVLIAPCRSPRRFLTKIRPSFPLAAFLSREL